MSGRKGNASLAQPFTLADLQRACSDAGAPPVQDTPYAQGVVAGVQILRDNAALVKSAAWQAAQNAARRKASVRKQAWDLIKSSVTEARAWHEAHLPPEPPWHDRRRNQLVADIEALAALQEAMANAERAMLGKTQKQGGHGPSALPPKPSLAMIADHLREAFVEAGHWNLPWDIPETTIRCVLAKVLDATPDAIRKALPPDPRREKHHRMVGELLGMTPAELRKALRPSPKPGRK